MTKQIANSEMSYGQSSSYMASKELEAAILTTVERIHAIFNDAPVKQSTKKAKKMTSKKKAAKKAA